MKKLLFAGLLLLTIQAKSTNITYYWIGGTSGNWTDGSKWSLTPGGGAANAYPGANDIFYFNTGDSIVVNYDMPGHGTGFKDFKISNQTKLTLINTVSVNTNRWFTINNGNSSAYYEVVESGSVLTLMSNSNLNHFSLGEDGFSSGRMVFNGKIICLNQAVNTNYGPRLNASTDSMIINNLFYYGEPTQGYRGSNPLGNKFRFGPNGIYQIDRDGGIFLFAKWEKGSLIKITGTRANFPFYWNGFYNSGNPLGGLVIDAPFANAAGFSTLSMPSNLVFQNDVTIRNLGNSGGVRFASTPKITIKGNLVIEKGNVSLGSSNTDTALIIVEGGLTLQSTATLNLQEGAFNTRLKVAGNLILNGTLNETGSSTGSTLELNGTRVQTIEQSGNINNTVNLRINNPSRIITTTDIRTSIDPNSSLELSLGRIDVLTNNKKCVIQNPSTTAINGGSSVSHVLGTLSRVTNSTDTYWFPISSNDSDFAPIEIKPDQANTANWDVSFEHVNPQANTGLPAGIGRIEPYRWNIIQTGSTNTPSNIKLFNGDIQGNIIAANPAVARVLRLDGTSWSNLGGTYTNNNAISNQINPVSSFGIFSLGIESSQPNLSIDRNLDFGNNCIQSEIIDSFTIQGTNLSAGNLALSALNGFAFALSFNGPYTSTLSITQGGGTLSPTRVFVSFQPAMVQSYSGSIQISGGGVSPISINIAGNGIGIVEPEFNAVAPICKGVQLATLPSSSINGINGSWSPAPNNTATTTYIFTPNAGQCADTTQLTIEVNEPVKPNFAPIILPLCLNSSFNPLSNTSMQGIAGSWSPTFNSNANTLYTFTPNPGQCADTTSIFITFSSCDAWIYPNPNQGTCVLNLSNLPAGNYQIVLYDEKGARVMSTQRTASEQSLDLRKLKKAIYLILVYDQHGNVILKNKLLVNP